MKTLGVLVSNRPATAGVLEGHEVPTVALDRAATSGAGVGSGDLFHVASSGAPIAPGRGNPLGDIGTRRGAQDNDTGRVQHVGGAKAARSWTCRSLSCPPPPETPMPRYSSGRVVARSGRDG